MCGMCRCVQSMSYQLQFMKSFIGTMAMSISVIYLHIVQWLYEDCVRRNCFIILISIIKQFLLTQSSFNH